MSLRVGIIGTGGVAAALGRAILRTGAGSVQFASRDPSSDKAKAHLAEVPGATSGGIHDTVEWATALIVAVPGWVNQEGANTFAATLGPNIVGKVYDKRHIVTMHYLYVHR